VRGMLLGLAVMVLGGVARGDVLVPYDNLGTGTGYTFNAHQAYAQSFTTGDFSPYGSSSLKIQNLKLNLFIQTVGTTTRTSFDVAIYSTLGPLPGSPVGFVSGNTSTLTTDKNTSLFQADVSSNNIVLNSNSTYWLVVLRSAYNNNGTQDLLAWATGTRGASVTAQGTTNSGSTWGDVSLGAAANDTFGAQIVMVPEPGTLLLGGIAAACGGGGVWWRRKRKAAPVVEAVERVTAV